MPTLPKLSDAELTTVTTLVMLGLSDATAIALIREQHGRKISRRTWVRWKSKHPQVKEAIALGAARSEHISARTIWSAMVQTNDLSLSVKTAQYWEQSRHGRSHRIKQTVEIEGELRSTAPTVQIYIPHNGRDNVKLSNVEPPEE